MVALAKMLIVLGVSILTGWMGPNPVWSESTEKEVSPEKDKPASRSPHPPAASDNQPPPHKQATEPKSPSQTMSPVKGESSTDHKELAPEKEKPASRSQHSPTSVESHATPHKPLTDPKDSKAQPPPVPSTKTELQPDNESKEKEPVVKKPLGSLILSVKLALMGDSRLFRYEIEVEDDQQTVTLTGRVSSEEEKVAATEVAQTVHGVKTVVNKIALEKDLAKSLLKKQDEILTALIKERFAKSATLKAANFDVKTEDGVVQLNGTVRFQVIALEAAETARQVPGVRAVNTEKIRLEGES